MGRRAITSAHALRLAAIYRDHLRRVRWVLRARGIGSDEIDDVVHDVFLAIHNRLGDDEPALEMGTWVCGVARSVAFAHRRGDARRHRAIAAVPEPEAMRLPDEELARREAWLLLEAVLDELPGEQREAFVSIDLLGMRAPEAATLLDAPLNTVYSRLRLARRHCETRLATLDDRGAWLQLAVAGEMPSASQRRRTWAGIVAALPIAIATKTTGVATWAIAVTIVAVTIGATIAARTDDAPVRLATQAPRDVVPTPTAIQSAPAEVPALGATTPTPEPIATPRAPVPRRVVAPTSSAAEPSTTDDLAAAVELLRVAEAAARKGDTTTALATIDDYRTRYGAGPLLRDALRLERRTACTVRDVARATRALADLAHHGWAAKTEAPCP